MDTAAYLDRVWNRFDPLEPLPPDDPHEWYQDLAQVRGPADVTQQIARKVARQSERPLRVLVLGHAGSGKSTEIGRLRRSLSQKGYRPVLAEVDRDLDREDLGLPEVQVLVVERVGAELSALGLSLSPELLARIDRWFAAEEVVEQHTTTRQASLDPVAMMKQVFGVLLPGFKADLRISKERRVKVRQRVQRHLREFVDLVADVVGEANAALQLAGFRGMVLLVDGLEKAAVDDDGRSRAASLLLDNSEQWAQLPVPLVLTAPLNLLSEKMRIQNHYDDFFMIPAVPVVPPPAHEGETPAYVVAARELTRRLVERRAKLERVFERPDDVDRLIEYSGGSIRDLFRLIRTAIDQAPEGALVDDGAIERAWKQHALQVSVALQPEDHEPLAELERSPTQLHYDDQGIGLLQRELVLPYVNGGRWFGVHPAVRPTVRGE